MTKVSLTATLMILLILPAVSLAFGVMSADMGSGGSGTSGTQISPGQAVNPGAKQAGGQGGSVTAVPEPGVLLLFSLGLIGVIWFGRRVRA